MWQLQRQEVRPFVWTAIDPRPVRDQELLTRLSLDSRFNLNPLPGHRSAAGICTQVERGVSYRSLTWTGLSHHLYNKIQQDQVSKLLAGVMQDS